MTAGGVTGTKENEEAQDEEGEADHPSSQPKPFSNEEKAWGAILYTKNFFKTSAVRYPPKDFGLDEQALALGLKPDGSGQLCSFRRAERLLFCIKALSTPERAELVEFATRRLEEWQVAHQETGEVNEQTPEEPHAPGLPPAPGTTTRPWRLPNLDLVLPPDAEVSQELAETQASLRKETQQLAHTLQQTLESYKVKAEVPIEDICIGSTVIRLGIRPTGIPEMRVDERGQRVPVRDDANNIVYKQRTKVSSILARQSDIALWLEAASIRMQAPVPGRPYVGVEIPNKHRREVRLREILKSEDYQAAARKSKLAVALGKDVTNRVCIADISRWPHLLVAGATDSGKSVFLNSILACILTKATPEDVRLLMVDPKMVELNLYNGIPHLLAPVVTEVDKAVPLLRNAVNEMEKRYQLFSSLGVRNLKNYRELRQERLVRGDNSLDNLPAIVIVIDELGDLMKTASEEIETLITRLTQLARATGIHLVVATQRPSADVITGVIKANLPTRVAFKVKSAINSRIILDMGGAERLIGYGDMLYQPEDSLDPLRIQATLITDKQVKALVKYWQEEWVRHINGTADAPPLELEKLVQLTLDPAWMVRPVEGGKRLPSSKTVVKEPALAEEQLFEQLTSYLLFDTIYVDGTPISVPLRRLDFEDQILVAEAITWRGHRGSAETLNRKLKTKQGPELRDALIGRGLMNAETQQPIHPSDRLAPLLVECGFIDAETHQRLETVTEEVEAEVADEQAGGSDEEGPGEEAVSST